MLLHIGNYKTLRKIFQKQFYKLAHESDFITTMTVTKRHSTIYLSAQRII